MPPPPPMSATHDDRLVGIDSYIPSLFHFFVAHTVLILGVLDKWIKWGLCINITSALISLFSRSVVVLVVMYFPSPFISVENGGMHWKHAAVFCVIDGRRMTGTEWELVMKIGYLQHHLTIDQKNLNPLLLKLSQTSHQLCLIHKGSNTHSLVKAFQIFWSLAIEIQELREKAKQIKYTQHKKSIHWGGKDTKCCISMLDFGELWFDLWISDPWSYEPIEIKWAGQRSFWAMLIIM